MSKLIDLTNQRFEKLTVLKRVENGIHGNARWECLCECGKTTIVDARNLRSGAVKSCGCLRQVSYNVTHNSSGTSLYQMWRSMLYRCENPKHTAYKSYGQRGICVCEEWHDFLVFKKWVEETKPSGKVTLDRIDNNKGYTPDNCKWSSPKEQAHNRRSNLLFEYQEKTHDLQQWSEILGFNYKTVHNRIYKLGWDFEKAISTPIDTKKRSRWKG